MRMTFPVIEGQSELSPGMLRELLRPLSLEDRIQWIGALSQISTWMAEDIANYDLPDLRRSMSDEDAVIDRMKRENDT